MNGTIARSSARTVVAVVFAAVVAQACDDPLDVDIVGTVTDESINSAASANALRVGTLGSVNGITAGATATFERGWVDIGLLTDEWKTSGPQQQYGELDRRTVPNTNTNLQNYYASLHRRAPALEKRSMRSSRIGHHRRGASDRCTSRRRSQSSRWQSTSAMGFR